MSGEKRARPVKVALIQRGPAKDKDNTRRDLLAQFDSVLEKERPDFIMPIELCTTPYFPAVSDERYFDWAEPIPGPTTDLFAEKARQYETCIILPIFEKGPLEGIYYNSAVVLGPDGNIIPGKMADGTQTQRYTKTHIPKLMGPQGYIVDETFYFTPGNGFPVFDTPKARIGILICHDRRFPEAWREVVLQGAEIVFVPVDSPVLGVKKGATFEEMFVAELRTRALENCVWVCATNQGGIETVQDKKNEFYGRSCIINPTGKVVKLAPASQPAVISAAIDLSEVATARRFLNTFNRRRPELYKLINSTQL
ncbi:MAG: nitrilase-related carbon-nitrogen hydrolase [Dehalococcoidales bacterium]